MFVLSPLPSVEGLVADADAALLLLVLVLVLLLLLVLGRPFADDTLDNDDRQCGVGGECRIRLSRV